MYICIFKKTIRLILFSRCYFFLNIHIIFKISHRQIFMKTFINVYIVSVHKYSSSFHISPAMFSTSSHRLWWLVFFFLIKCFIILSSCFENVCYDSVISQLWRNCLWFLDNFTHLSRSIYARTPEEKNWI